MEKIWIQFNESDYQIYHNYCLRYYTIHDTSRKRSIHLFLELFEKGIISVNEHDLSEAFSYFSKKCDVLQSDYKGHGSQNPAVDHPQFQICRDIQFLIEDLEKLYRLIQKTDIPSDYFMILATFSKIIEEEKTAYVSAVNEMDRTNIEFYAPEIAKSIRKRLGPDAGWDSILFELIQIIRKFNREFPLQKISPDCIFLIGSAVISFFNVNVGNEEIQSTLERYFEESELDEFESFLNQRPIFPDRETDSDLDRDLLFNALKSISGKRVNEGYLETGLDPRLLEDTDIHSVISPVVISRNSGAITPSQEQFIHPFEKSLENYSRIFEIVISETVKSLVILPEKKVDRPYQAVMKPGIPQYSLLVMGFIILIIFVISIGPASGIWNPVKTMDNSSTGITSNVSNLVNNSKISTPLVKTTTPAKQIEGKMDTSVTPQTTNTALSSADINKHFMRIAFGPANTIIQKPEDERLIIAITGDYDDNDTVILDKFTTLFNNNAISNQFTNGIKFGEQGSVVLNFLPESSLKNIVIEKDTTISKNSKTGVINYLRKTVKQQFVITEEIYINSDLQGDIRTHWILRSVLYELGFTGETVDYPDSIFYSGSENITQLSEIDLKGLQIMYSNKITNKMTFDRVKTLLLI